MPTYIEKEALKNQLCKAARTLKLIGGDKYARKAFTYCINRVDEQLPADVAEVRRGCRVKLNVPENPTSKFEFACGNCEAYLFASDEYCPNCGADMRGKEKHGN